MVFMMKILETLIRRRVKKTCETDSHLPRLWELYAEIANESEDDTDGETQGRVERIPSERTTASQ